MFSEIRCTVLVVMLYMYVVPRANGLKLQRTERPEDLVTDYQRENWLIWFAGLDVNGDEILSTLDLDITMNRYISAFKLDTKEKSEMVYASHFWWKNLIQQGDNSNKISKIEFVAYLTKTFLTDKHFREKVVVMDDIFIDMMDVDKDGAISKEEFLEFYKDTGFKNKKVVEEFFYAFNPIQDKIPNKQMSRAWADFSAGSPKANDFIRKYMIKLLGLQNQFTY